MYTVSFCIPEYNNGKELSTKIKKMLSTKEDRFQIVVVDNASTNGEIKNLESIIDDRFKLVKNTKNIGPQKNWCKALDEGDGEYLYFFHANDTLDISRINTLLGFLENAKNKKLLCLRDKLLNKPLGEGQFFTYNKVDSICRMIGHYHQTGLIVERIAFKRLSNRYDYFDNKYIYPENYLCRDILLLSNAGEFCSGMRKVTYDVSKKSYMHGADITKLWFYPNVRCDDTIKVLEMILFENGFHLTNTQKRRVIMNFWKDLCHAVSFGYRACMIDSGICNHYGLDKEIITDTDMLKSITNAYNRITIWAEKKDNSNQRVIRRLMKTHMLLKILMIKNPLYIYNVKYHKQLSEE